MERAIQARKAFSAIALVIAAALFCVIIAAPIVCHIQATAFDPNDTARPLLFILHHPTGGFYEK